MKLRVITESGSEYVVDDEAAVWRRIDRTERSGRLRTGGTGPLWSVMTIVASRSLLIEGPPVDPAMQLRVIHTTPVVSWTVS